MSTKVRVYELASETGLSSKDVLKRLGDLDIPAATASSSVSLGDAKRFRETLGQSKEQLAEQQRKQDAARQAELERYKTMQVKKPPEGKKAAKVLPPHLRKQAEEAERARKAAEAAQQEAAALEPAKKARMVPQGGTPFRPAQPTTSDAAAATAPATPAAEATPAAAASAPATSEPAAAPAAKTTGGTTGSPALRRMPGAPPPKVDTASVPRRPNARTPVVPPSTVTGAAPTSRRRAETNLPQEGSGRRSIPAPLRKAPARPTSPDPRRGGPGGGPGSPGGPPSRGAPSRGAPPGGGRGGPGGSPYRGGPGGPGGRGGPGGPGGRGGPGGPGGPGGAPSGGRRKRKGRKDRTQPAEQSMDFAPQRRDLPLEEQIEVDRIEILRGATINEISEKLDVSGAAIVKKLFEMGEMVTVQQSLPEDTIEILAAELGFEVYFMSDTELEFGIEDPEDPENLEHRPPVITVMGHVDHGKTLLLDAIRNADVVSGEAGGITQHIGAYQVTKNDKLVTFIDTPGHAAFTAMRARGANMTDIVILVVAANDGVMPQTVEAIEHAKAAEVPVIVAINKMDLDDVNPDKVKGQLTEHEIVVEEYGGEVPAVPVSAKTGMGLDDLLEVVQLQAEVLELEANPDKDARGRVVEANLDRGRGVVATLLVQAGTLKRGDILVAGQSDGKIRAMFDANGKQVKEATPSKPVQVLGLNEVPEAGDEFRVVDAASFARDVAERRQWRERRAELAEQQRPMSLDDLMGKVAESEKAVLNVIVKADVSGSAEALNDALLKLELDEVLIKVLRKSVGAITQDDVVLAEASDAIIVGFNVRPDSMARDEIDRSGVDVRLYKIIYEAIEDIERAVKGLLGPTFEEQVVGEAECREIFKVPRAGFVFGSMVTRGIVKRDASVRVIRDGVVVADDTMSSLRRFKDDVQEVREGFECGIGLNKFQDVKVGDVFEVYETVEVERE